MNNASYARHIILPNKKNTENANSLSAAATTAADDDDWGNSDWGLPSANTAAAAAPVAASVAAAGQSHGGQTEYAQHQASHANTNQVKGLLLSLCIYLILYLNCTFGCEPWLG